MSEETNDTKSIVEKIFDSYFARLEESESFDDSAIQKISSLHDQRKLANKSQVEKALKPEEVENEDHRA